MLVRALLKGAFSSLARMARRRLSIEMATERGSCLRRFAAVSGSRFQGTTVERDTEVAAASDS